MQSGHAPSALGGVCVCVCVWSEWSIANRFSVSQSSSLVVYARCGHYNVSHRALLIPPLYTRHTPIPLSGGSLFWNVSVSRSHALLRTEVRNGIAALEISDPGSKVGLLRGDRGVDVALCHTPLLV